MRRQKNFASKQSGLSYVEVLAAVVLVAVTVLPATNALRGAMDIAEADTEATVDHYHLVAKLEEVLADRFDVISARAAGSATPTEYSDASGSPDRRVVFVSRYDGDNADADNNPFTGADPGLLWIQVGIEGSVNEVHALKTL